MLPVRLFLPLLIPIACTATASMTGSTLAQYYNFSIWQTDAQQIVGTSVPMPVYVQNFIGSTLNNGETPGLTVSNTAFNGSAPGIDYISTPGQNGAAYAYNGFDGKRAYDPVTGNQAYWASTLFTMPQNIVGMGFDFAAPASEMDNPIIFGIQFTDGSSFTQWLGSSGELQSPAYSGFLGWTAGGSQIASVDVISGAPWQIGAIYLADPATAPEPLSLCLTGLGLAGAGVLGWKRRKGKA